MSLFLDEYSLDEEQKNNLDLLLNNLNLNTLNSYILNKSSREKIVSKNFSNLIKNRNRLQKFFTSINSSIDYESLNDSQKDIILSFFNHD
ncbi:MAG: hypothetical protein P1U46_02740 [Patescibacteria group bacterium]|nr:hypothetical protein [Patescibacteria group bacterium]